ncbi:hypothetical protein BDR26DRAFT_848731, partial [Obelidium mucronatum]
MAASIVRSPPPPPSAPSGLKAKGFAKLRSFWSTTNLRATAAVEPKPNENSSKSMLPKMGSSGVLVKAKSLDILRTAFVVRQQPPPPPEPPSRHRLSVALSADDGELRYKPSLQLIGQSLAASYGMGNIRLAANARNHKRYSQQIPTAFEKTYLG